MGFFDLPGGSNNKKVTKEEFNKKVKQGLYNKGLTQKEIDEVGDLLATSFESKGSHKDKGIQKDEIDQVVNVLKEDKKHHTGTFTDKDIKAVDEELKKRL